MRLAAMALGSLAALPRMAAAAQLRTGSGGPTLRLARVSSAASCLLAASAVMGTAEASLRIRQAMASDVSEMKRINELVLPENYPQAFYLQHLNEWPSLQLVACGEGSEGIVGYCLAKMEDAISGHIISIAVLPEHRNCGAATAIMREVTELMRRGYGAARVTLNVRVSNEAALHVYTSKLGYRKEAIYASYYANGEDALHLLLPLEPAQAVQSSTSSGRGARD